MTSSPGRSTGPLADTISMLGQHGRHVAAHASSGRWIVIGLVSLVVISCLLVAPVLGGNLADSFSVGAAKVAPAIFVLGLGILGTGIVTGVGILDLVGACMVGAVLLGLIVTNY